MQGFLIYTTMNFMETAYVHTLKTNANMMTTDLEEIVPCFAWDWIGLFRTGGLVSGKLFSEHKQNTKPNHFIHRTKQ